MEKKSAESAVNSANANESALDTARRWLLELCGPRGWNDTHESMFARAAKRAAMNPRRVRAIIQKERHTKVSGDEILAIQSARLALQSLQALAREANALAGRVDEREGRDPIQESQGNPRPRR